MAFLVFHTEAGWVARRYSRHIAAVEAEHSRRVAVAGEAVDSHSRPAVEEDHSCEVYKDVNIGTKEEVPQILRVVVWLG